MINHAVLVLQLFFVEIKCDVRYDKPITKLAFVAM